MKVQPRSKPPSHVSNGSTAPGSDSRPRGFSLIELLVVIAIIGLLAAMTVPALQSINRASGVTDATAQIAAAIERTRAEAVARNTFAWMAMEEIEVDGTKAIRIATVISQDGSTNSSDANTKASRQAIVIERVGMLDAPAAPAGAVQLSTLTGLPLKVGAHEFSAGSSHVLTFTPGGEITKKLAPTRTTGFTPLMVARFASAMGTVLETNNPVDLWIDGSTGFSSIRRP